MAYKSDAQSVDNVGGFLGAHLASLLIFLLGGAAFFAIGGLLYAAYLIITERTWRQELDRFFALIFCTTLTAALCTRYQFALFGSDYTGGLVGHVVYTIIMKMIGEPVATVVMLAVWLCSFVILTRGILMYLLRCLVAAIDWLCRHRAQFAYVGSWVVKICYAVVAPCVWIANYVYRVLSGAVLLKRGRSLVDFERGCGPDEQVRTIAEDTFWRTYLTEIANENAQLDSSVAKDKYAVEPAEQLDCNDCFAQEEKRYQLPLTTLLHVSHAAQQDKQAMADMQVQARLLEEKLAHFGIEGSVVAIKKGPVVTLFEYQPDINARISKITALDDDLALALQAMSIRIIAPIPGKSVIGFEVANKVRATVSYADIIQSTTFAQCTGSLPLALGVDTAGNHIVVDLAKMPHVLIAGSTGSGKSVAMHTMIMSLLYKRTPDDLKLILIDPKRLEFAAYKDIAHLVFPIVMQPKETIPVLKWVVEQMEERYEIMTSVGARNINDYHALCKGLPDNPPMPFLVVIIDELADLMMTCGRDIEDLIARVAQMARAAGIHMIVATQRPSVDVITGLIKVNFPSRISCRVTSKVDSRTILDCNGAEKLLGRGDMLFLDSADSSIKRVHGAYVSDAEIAAVVNHIRAQREPAYLQLQNLASSDQMVGPADDALFKDVVAFLHNVDEISISLLQRRFRIGFNRSARIIELLESQGFIAPCDGSKMRKVIRQ
jgi:S-DNA-T family DNA segregation ATPase FtsK/SpoIIIE